MTLEELFKELNENSDFRNCLNDVEREHPDNKRLFLDLINGTYKAAREGIKKWAKGPGDRFEDKGEFNYRYDLVLDCLKGTIIEVAPLIRKHLIQLEDTGIANEYYKVIRAFLHAAFEHDVAFEIYGYEGFIKGIESRIRLMLPFIIENPWVKVDEKIYYEIFSHFYHWSDDKSIQFFIWNMLPSIAAVGLRDDDRGVTNHLKLCLSRTLSLNEYPSPHINVASSIRYLIQNRPSSIFASKGDSYFSIGLGKKSLGVRKMRDKSYLYLICRAINSDKKAQRELNNFYGEVHLLDGHGNETEMPFSEYLSSCIFRPGTRAMALLDELKSIQGIKPADDIEQLCLAYEETSLLRDVFIKLKQLASNKRESMVWNAFSDMLMTMERPIVPAIADFHGINLNSEKSIPLENLVDGVNVGSCIGFLERYQDATLSQIIDPYIGFMFLTPFKIENDTQRNLIDIGIAYVVCCRDNSTGETVWMVDSVEGGNELRRLKDSEIWLKLFYDGIKNAAADAYAYFTAKVREYEEKVANARDNEELKEELEAKLQEYRNKIPHGVLANDRVYGQNAEKFVRYCCEQQGQNPQPKARRKQLKEYSLTKHCGMDAIRPFSVGEPAHYMEAWAHNIRKGVRDDEDEKRIDPTKPIWNPWNCCDSVKLGRNVRAVEIWNYKEIRKAA